MATAEKLHRCLDHVRQLTRSRKWKHKRGRGQHIATDHGLMVQGELLTAHTGGVHGYGWSPGGVISLRQGAGAASPGAPDLKTAVAAEQRGFRGIFFSSRVSTPRAIYRRRGPWGGHLGQPG